MKVMNKELQKHTIRKMIGEDNDLVDVESEIDSSLSLDENVAQLKKKGLIKDEIVFQPDEVVDLAEKELDKRLQEELKELKTSTEVDSFYANLIKSIELLLDKKSNFNLLIVAGRGGTGKTFQVRKILAKKNVSFTYRSGHITPFELFRILYDNYKTDVLILDDSNPILENNSSVSLLLQACDTRDVREVMWNTSRRMDIRKRFEFEGKIVIITNKDFEDVYEPLATRSIKCEVNFDNETMLKVINALCHLPEKDKIMGLLRENMFKMEINLRLYRLLELLVNHLKPNLKDFNKLGQFYLDLESNPAFKFVYETLKSTNDVKKTITKAKDEFGISRATFFRYKSRIQEIMGVLC